MGIGSWSTLLTFLQLICICSVVCWSSDYIEESGLEDEGGNHNSTSQEEQDKGGNYNSTSHENQDEDEEKFDEEMENIHLAILNLQLQLFDTKVDLNKLNLKEKLLEQQIQDNIGDVVSCPTALLFHQANREGTFLAYNLERSNVPFCSSLNEIAGNVSSLSTLGSCIRLYSEDNCTGISIAFYPGSSLPPDESILSSRLSGGQSIGPCFVNELEGALTTETNKGIKYFKKLLNSYSNLTIPDQLYLGSPIHLMRLETFELENKTTYRVRRGFGGRIEFVEIRGVSSRNMLKKVILKQENLVDDSQSEETRDTNEIDDSNQIDDEIVNQKKAILKLQEDEMRTIFERLNPRGGDLIGAGLREIFGHVTTNLTNLTIFPQTQRNAQILTLKDDEAVDIIMGNPNDVFDIRHNFIYSNETFLRPVAITYTLLFSDNHSRIIIFTSISND